MRYKFFLFSLLSNANIDINLIIINFSRRMVIILIKNTFIFRLPKNNTLSENQKVAGELMSYTFITACILFPLTGLQFS